MKNIRRYLLFALIGLFALASSAQEQKSEIPLRYGADRVGKRQDAAMQRFRSNRLGAFIHWGLYAIPGGEWNGRVYNGAAEWLKNTARVSRDDWMALMQQWNPQHFDATAWARMFKRMGVRYVKITTKHHEGFCLWPSKYTRYTVANTPYGRDILGEIVRAMDAEGIDVHFYFSILDWSHPDWRYALQTAEDSAAFERFKTFTENQLRELCERYPTVRDFWFDGTWNNSVKQNGAWTAHLEHMLKELVPGVTVNSRLRADDLGSRHFDSNYKLMGDYESGYERRLPDPQKDLRVTQWDWEACMTLPENQWGYHKDWSLSYVKTPTEVLENIVHAVSMGGNMVVNFGPKADGTFRAEEHQMADAVGTWMARYGEAVYGCDYAGLPKQDWGYYTQRADTLYAIVFNRPYTGFLVVKTDKNRRVASAQTLDGKPLTVTETASQEYHVALPEKDPKGPFAIRLFTTAPDGKGKEYKEALT